MRDENVEPLGGLRTHVAEEDAERLFGAAADSAAQLVQLRETEALRVLDHHHRRVGHVDADLDHGRSDEQIDRPSRNARMMASRSSLGTRPCRRATLAVRERPGREHLVHRRRRLQVGLLRLGDDRIDDVALSSCLELAVDELEDARARRFATKRRRDRVAPGRPLVERLRSRSPYSVSASERGMGVADISRMSGISPFALSALRCSTPKRCCSSIAANPSFANTVASCTSACVPITSTGSAAARSLGDGASLAAPEDCP